MGAIGGSLLHAYKGFRNSPQGERTLGAFNAVKQRAPMIGGNFAVWASVFSSFDCTCYWWRQKEDPWNPIMAGAMTGAVLAGRGGPMAMARSGLFGGIFLALIEGANIMFGRMASHEYRPPSPTTMPTSSGGSQH